MEVRSALTGKRGVSLPFTDSCEPFLTAGKWLEQIPIAVAAYGKKAGWKYLEMRDWPEVAGQNASTRYFGHSLSLTRPEETTFSQFSENTRRNIKKALKAGVATTVSTSRESMEQFCRMNLLTRKGMVFHLSPIDFSGKFLSMSLKRVWVLSFGFIQGTTVAGSIFFHFGSNAIYK
jgi:hypothetical protein